ncbi:MAG: glycosyltransferase family 4 protein [Syntrophobacterales bacterium]|nr:glycosyltransferase family 4 protein [Syntrophobacterales bacterium]
MANSHLPQIIVAQLGARMHYAVPVLLHRAGMLAHFYTDAYVGPGSAWHWLTRVAPLIPESWRPAGFRRLRQRRADGLPAARVTAFNLLGYRYARALARAVEARERFTIHRKFGDLFCQAVLRQATLEGDAVYAFQGAALPLLKSLKPRGWRGFYEQFIAPAAIVYQIYREEHRRWPEWEESPLIAPDQQNWLERHEQETWEEADVLICGSEFVRQGLLSQGAAPEKIQVVPYGVELGGYTVQKPPWDGRRPLRLLFVGLVTIRKGVQYLTLALEQLRGLPLEVRIVGRVALKEPGRARLAKVAQLTGQVPRMDVSRHYHWADVFVLPSPCEGSATVTYEALAHGLPVITTFNAGSVVRDGVEGYILPIRDPEALAGKIAHLYRNPDLVAWMSENARARARDFSWEKYEERLTSIIKTVYHDKV